MHLLEYPEIASFCPSPVWGGDSCVQTANRSYCEPGRPQRRLSKKSEVMRTRAGTETRPSVAARVRITSAFRDSLPGG